MLEAIRDVHEETGRKVGMKPAGGIRHAKQAVQYLVQLYETLGPDWLTPDLYRFGASLAPQRRAHADPQGADRPLPEPGLLHDRLMTELEKKSRGLPVESGWDYARRARVARHRLASTSATACSSAASGSSRAPASGTRRSARRRRSRSRRSRRRGPRTSTLAVDAARAAYENGWSALPGSERAKYLFRISRILQERAREFAVLESLNGGKPIKESRDVDLPLAAAHFFYYAGWADKLEYAFPNRAPRPLGVAGQIIPWNFPLLMLAWKIAPALATGNTVVLKPAETTPLTALLFCDVLRQAELPPASSTSSRATAARAPRSSQPTSTRSPSRARPRSARRSSARSPARASG